MPREIADSDAESDFDSPRRPSASPITENQVEVPPPSTLEQDPFANIEFDQFLSPTQRLSSIASQQDARRSRSTGSTDKFLRELAQEDQGIFDSTTNTYGLDGSSDQSSNVMPTNKPKRTLSDIETASGSKNTIDARSKSVKRAKTYGNTRSYQSGSSLFSDHGMTAVLDKQLAVKSSAGTTSETASVELPVKQLINPAISFDSTSFGNTFGTGAGQVYQSYGTNSFVQGNLQNASMTRSAVGGYEGINFDFRGSGLGLDVNANPFGSLSQISLEGDVDMPQTENFSSHFQDDRIPQHQLNLVDLDDITAALQPSHLKEMSTSPFKGLSRDTQHRDEDDGHDDFTASDIQVSANVPKKRGRKPKRPEQTVDEKKLSDVSTFRVSLPEGAEDEPRIQHKPGTNRHRTGTMESIDTPLAQDSRSTESSKSKRRDSARHETKEEVGNELARGELNLSDPVMIGAPKEMYKPRPSKSRSKRIVDEDDQDELQKEDITNSISVHDAEESPVKSLEPTPSTSVKKSAKKKKVKRAKTSAAALLKSAEMYNEDDKDCIVVDEIPVKFKMADLPDIIPTKKEAASEVHTSEERYQDLDEDHADQIAVPISDVKISVDIPQLSKPAESEPGVPKAEPKKRGRKPKKKLEVAVVAEPEIEVKTRQVTPTVGLLPGDETSLNDRPALSEKDPNTASPTKTSIESIDDAGQKPSPSPPKPVHSPLKAPSRSVTPSGNLWNKPRVGLSRRTPIPSLLRKLDRARDPPKVVERKEKLTKRQLEEEERRKLEAEDAGEAYVDRWDVRGKDGMLLEWDD